MLNDTSTVARSKPSGAGICLAFIYGDCFADEHFQQSGQRARLPLDARLIRLTLCPFSFLFLKRVVDMD